MLLKLRGRFQSGLLRIVQSSPSSWRSPVFVDAVECLFFDHDHIGRCLRDLGIGLMHEFSQDHEIDYHPSFFDADDFHLCDLCDSLCTTSLYLYLWRMRTSSTRKNGRKSHRGRSPRRDFIAAWPVPSLAGNAQEQIQSQQNHPFGHPPIDRSWPIRRSVQ